MVVMFYLLAAVAVISALMVVTRPNAVHSAMWLVLTFFAVAGLFILQGAEFIAAVQVLVYAGGIMVLFLFVIMLVNVDQVAGFVRTRGRIAAALVLSVLAIGSVGAVIATSGAPVPVPVAQGGLGEVFAGASQVEGIPVGNMEQVGMALLTHYLLAFELVSIVLLVAIIGAVVLCRREL